MVSKTITVRSYVDKTITVDVELPVFAAYEDIDDDGSFYNYVLYRKICKSRSVEIYIKSHSRYDCDIEIRSSATEDYNINVAYNAEKNGRLMTEDEWNRVFLLCLEVIDGTHLGDGSNRLGDYVDCRLTKIRGT